jgi:hypothetical protein
LCYGRSDEINRYRNDRFTPRGKLGARLAEDDSEEYHADGSSEAWTEPRPILFHRRLNLDEAAAAWEAIFEL